MVKFTQKHINFNHVKSDFVVENCRFMHKLCRKQGVELVSFGLGNLELTF